MSDDVGLKCVATIEARMTSTRLPGKILMPAGGKPLLQILIERLRRASGLDEIMLATTENSIDDPVAALGHAMGVSVFRGSEDDVLGRVCGALRAAKADICVEITGDCPLLDPQIVGEAIQEFLKTKDRHLYISNSDPHRSVPAGLDVQVFWAKALYKLDEETIDPDDREHVSYGFYRPESGDRWAPRFITHPSCAGAEGLLVTLDYVEDYTMIKQLHEELSVTFPVYGAAYIIRWVRAHSDLQGRCQAVRMSCAR
jgi:spore coat polysaccharide biosynthesis protein SpsF